MITLILWERNYSLFPADPEKRMKLIQSQIEMTKKAVDSGETKMWGISPGGGYGFSITEGDAKGILARTAAFAPYIKFEVRPMLSIDEVIDAMKGMQQ
jgi:hypothetical protein